MSNEEARGRQPRMRDVDVAERVHRLRAGFYAIGGGGSVGAAAGYWVAKLGGFPPVLGMLAGAVVSAGITFRVTWMLSQRAGDAARMIYAPSGASTPRAREFSYALSLVARGRYEDAAVAFEACSTERPDDPEAYLQLARLHRDHLGRYEDAIAWYRRARSDARLTAGQEMHVTQEIAEIYVRRLRAPGKAIPELARLSERFPDAPAGRAAKRELEQIRELLAREREGLGSFTTEYLKGFGLAPPSTTSINPDNLD